MRPGLVVTVVTARIISRDQVSTERQFQSINYNVNNETKMKILLLNKTYTEQILPFASITGMLSLYGVSCHSVNHLFMDIHADK